MSTHIIYVSHLFSNRSVRAMLQVDQHDYHGNTTHEPLVRNINLDIQSKVNIGALMVDK